MSHKKENPGAGQAPGQKLNLQKLITNNSELEISYV